MHFFSATIMPMHQVCHGNITSSSLKGSILRDKPLSALEVITGVKAKSSEPMYSRKHHVETGRPNYCRSFSLFNTSNYASTITNASSQVFLASYIFKFFTMLCCGICITIPGCFRPSSFPAGC